MVIKGCKSIAEYKFRRWMQKWDFAEGCFSLVVDGNKGVIQDMNGNTLELVYDNESKCVEVRE